MTRQQGDDALAYFALNVDEWLSSPDVSVMTICQEGAYIRLLCFQWKSKDCTIPDDEGKIQRLVKMDDALWEASRVLVLEQFPTSDSGTRRNRKLFGVWKEAWEVYKRRSKRGSDAASARWSKQKQLAGMPSPEEPGEESRKDKVKEIFALFKEIAKKRVKFDDTIGAKIAARLNQGHTFAEFKLAFEGNAASSWHRKNGHTSIGLICRNEEKFDRFVELGMAASKRGKAEADFMRGNS